MTIALTVHSQTDPTPMTISIEPERVILGGYSARSAADRDRHIAELREIGIEPPEEVPAFWHVSPWLLTTATAIEVQGTRTSGEIEYALISHGGRTYVAVASDQTDREFERHSIPRSKQLCPKVVSADVVPLEEIADVWDDIVIESEVSSDGVIWRTYQRAALGALLDPGAIVHAVSGTAALRDETVLLSGTVPLIDGVTRYDAHFRGTMRIPGRDTGLSLRYRVDVLPVVTTQKEFRT